LGLLPMLIFHVILPGTLSSVVLAAKVCSENIHSTHLFYNDSPNENYCQYISAIHVRVL